MLYNVIINLDFTSNFKNIKGYTDIKQLLNYFHTKSDTTYIQCFNSEHKIIDIFKAHNLKYTLYKNIIIFNGASNEIFNILNSIDTSSKCPLFSIILEHKGDKFLYIEHYGKEYNLLNLTSTDVDFITAIFPQKNIQIKEIP